MHMRLRLQGSLEDETILLGKYDNNYYQVQDFFQCRPLSETPTPQNTTNIVFIWPCSSTSLLPLSNDPTQH